MLCLRQWSPFLTQSVHVDLVAIHLALKRGCFVASDGKWMNWHTHTHIYIHSFFKQKTTTVITQIANTSKRPWSNCHHMSSPSGAEEPSCWPAECRSQNPPHWTFGRLRWSCPRCPLGLRRRWPDPQHPKTTEIWDQLPPSGRTAPWCSADLCLDTMLVQPELPTNLVTKNWTHPQQWGKCWQSWQRRMDMKHKRRYHKMGHHQK